MSHPSSRRLKKVQHFSIATASSTDLEWGWDPLEATDQVMISDDAFDIVIHPERSNGTGAVRGNSPLMSGHIYYWELEIYSSLQATDMVVGVGTKDFDLKGSQNYFTSLVGSDEKSWGYSFRGIKQHDGVKSPYGLEFKEDINLIGVRLDMCRGTLEFFQNRKPLGIAFKELNKEHLLYPMVSATGCYSQFTIKYCCSMPVNLQIRCLQALDHYYDQSMPPGLLKQAKELWWITQPFSLKAHNRVMRMS